MPPVPPLSSSGWARTASTRTPALIVGLLGCIVLLSLRHTVGRPGSQPARQGTKRGSESMTVSKRAQELLADLEAAAAELEAAARAVPAPLYHQRPDAEEWSVGEILAHMANSPRFYVSEVRRLLQEGGGA